MKKFSVIFLILFLILFTALVKNSTKRIDDEIFVKEENIRSLRKDFENIKLEFDYLSSCRKITWISKSIFWRWISKKNIQRN